ncbi:hypothetical protein RD792_012923 [Penstemon davidsonii]|uniref:Auxin-responsive protein n=1 Tax=Penstemon davidsonii TaxID=160366 RepID=A0ABR0CY83_9LAMI|nr:hypothetical protein RD792_012923 [Penstemon davidsonii]
MEEGYSIKDEGGCPQLLDLIPKERDWVVKRAEETRDGLSQERKLELSLGLGPPGGEWTIKENNNTERYHHIESSSLLSFGNYFSNQNHPVMRSPWQQQQQQTKPSPYFHLQSTHPVIKESCSNRAAVEQTAEKNTAVLNNSSSAQKRTAPAPVVGWPPIRSFRKNLASGSSSKSASDSQNAAPKKVSSQKPTENSPKGLFVKINMDGIPIGRKVDLKAYDSYEKLSVAVDELFRGLLAAQCDSSDKNEGGKVVGGLLDGSGEYTLVYEDNEGDRMLVGDVPWHMFISTVKRLRVLKSSELPKLSRGCKQGKLSLNK